LDQKDQKENAPGIDVLTGFRIQREDGYWIGVVLRNNKIKFIKVSDGKIGLNSDFPDKTTDQP
jgi:hypothetical protein